MAVTENQGPDDLPTFLGKYAVEDELGRGGMKIVVKAFDQEAQRTVALGLVRRRFPTQEILDRFFREARAMQSLVHPNIVKVYEHGTIDGQAYFSMEYVEGEPLSTWLLSGGMPAGDAIEYILPVCEAIQYAHHQGIYHRDIKPANILIDQENSPRLLDFGLAKDASDEQQLTREGQGLGTLVYVAPEQRAGDATANLATCDIYSLGITLLEMLLGTSTLFDQFSRNLPHNQLLQLQKDSASVLQAIPASLVEIGRRCVQFDSSERYQSMAEVIAALKAVDAKDLQQAENHRQMLEETEQTADFQHRISNEDPGQKAIQPLEPGTLICRKYTLKTLLRQSLMGEVWTAEASNRTNAVVVKFLPEVLRYNQFEMQNLRSTFQLVESLHHGNICPLYDLDEDPAAGIFIVMRYVDGIDLQQLCRRRRAADRPFSVNEVCRILYPIAQAIDHAHSKKVLHRDIKTDNIMVNEDGSNPQLVDFGLAEEIRASVTRVSNQRGPAGTLQYIAPEVWQGYSHSCASDQYALGVVAYEMLGGKTPFGSISDTAMLCTCVTQQPIPALNIAEPVNHVLNKVLSKQPEQRFENCTSFVEALRRGAEPRTPLAQPHSEKSPTDRFSFVLYMAGIATLLGAGWYGVANWQNDAVAVAEQAVDVDKTGPGEEKEAELKPTVKNQPDPKQQAEAALERGKNLLAEEAFSRAIAEFNQAIELDPQLAEAFQLRGFANAQLGQYDEGLEDLDRALDVDPANGDAYLTKGDILKLRGIQLLDEGEQEVAYSYLEGALGNYTKAAEYMPDESLAMHGRGLTNAAYGFMPEAIDDFTAAIAAGRVGPDIYEHRGNAYFEQEEFEKARRDYTRALEIDPDRSYLEQQIDNCRKNAAISQ